MNHAEGKALLNRGDHLYSVSIEGDHIRRCLFTSLNDAIMALFDSIYLRDSVGFANKENPPNSPVTNLFRFESMLRVNQFSLVDEELHCDIKKTCLKVPALNVNNGDYNYYDYTAITIDKWLEMIVLEDSYSTCYKTTMVVVPNPLSDLWVNKSYRVDISEIYSFYFTLIKNGTTPSRTGKELLSDRVIDALGRNLISETLKPQIRIYREIEDQERIKIIETIDQGIEDGESVAQLHRRGSFTEAGQAYTISEEFYRKLWLRDLPQFDLDEAEFADFYMPHLGLGWNYQRYMDYETVGSWIAHWKVVLFPKKGENAEVIGRFSSSDLEKIKEISMCDEAYFGRIKFFINQSDSTLTVRFEKVEKFQEILSQIEGIMNEDLVFGKYPNTAVSDKESFVISLKHADCLPAVKHILSYVIRNLKFSQFRFG